MDLEPLNGLSPYKTDPVSELIYQVARGVRHAGLLIVAFHHFKGDLAEALEAEEFKQEISKLGKQVEAKIQKATRIKTIVSSVPTFSIMGVLTSSKCLSIRLEIYSCEAVKKSAEWLRLNQMDMPISVYHTLYGTLLGYDSNSLQGYLEQTFLLYKEDEYPTDIAWMGEL